MNDDVRHPGHYTSHPSGVECITVTEHMNFNLGNAIKYIWRAGLKGKQVKDLQKAAWYIQREIERIQIGEAIHEAKLAEEQNEEQLCEKLRSAARLFSDHIGAAVNEANGKVKENLAFTFKDGGWHEEPCPYEWVRKKAKEDKEQAAQGRDTGRVVHPEADTDLAQERAGHVLASKQRRSVPEGKKAKPGSRRVR